MGWEYQHLQRYTLPGRNAPPSCMTPGGAGPSALIEYG